jgi:hypothetical protein
MKELTTESQRTQRKTQKKDKGKNAKYEGTLYLFFFLCFSLFSL